MTPCWVATQIDVTIRMHLFNVAGELIAWFKLFGGLSIIEQSAVLFINDRFEAKRGVAVDQHVHWSIGLIVGLGA